MTVRYVPRVSCSLGKNLSSRSFWTSLANTCSGGARERSASAKSNCLHRGLTSAVNAASLDGDEKATTLLQEQLRVDTDNSGLIGLGNIGKDDVDHREKHAVSHGLTSVLNDPIHM